jgi:hypothetical protein
LRFLTAWVKRRKFQGDQRTSALASKAEIPRFCEYT